MSEKVSGGAELRETIRDKYGEAARQAAGGQVPGCGAVGESPEPVDSSCCGPQECCGGDGSATATATRDVITADLYEAGETSELPDAAVLASLGCGNPTALAQLSPGEVVLDLGSGGGIDVLLSARRVGPTGKAYGLDMTDEMLDLAESNRREAGVENAEFLKGEIENIPLPESSVDVIISNCVINLSADKRRVLDEAFRVLKPGGRFAVSDIVVRGAVPAEVRQSVELWIGCVAGALQDEEYLRLLADAGFTDIEIEPTRVYRLEEARGLVAQLGPDAERIASAADGKFMSAFVRARKPL
jgi:SAM-dependent methyltransferase